MREALCNVLNRFAWLQSLRQRFSGRADSEHEQAFIRLIIGILLFFYFYFFQFARNSSIENRWSVSYSWVMATFIGMSIAIIAHIACFPRISPIRRLLAATLDSSTVTYFFFNAAESAIPLYFLYLWIIFGHGFRFGRYYLFFALCLSLFGFGAVILRIPYWIQNRFLGLGLWSGMLFVSMYVGALIERLTTALKHAEAANQAKRKFISSVSHELRTPLNAIIGMADLLRSTELSRHQADMVHSMENASHVMLTLIEDVLDFSKIEAGKLVMENIPFDLHELVRSTTDIFKYQAARHNLRFITYIDPAAPYQLTGDPHHLRQVFVNLLSNAIKFTNKGRVVFRIETLNETPHSAKLRFEVQDTGIGISSEAREKVFESFTQAHVSTARHFGGTGLGTTISKQLVELMSGRLGLESQLGTGSTFWFELELGKQANAVDQPMLSDMRVLLAGLESDETDPIAAMLEQCEISCDRAHDIPEALALLRNAGRNGSPFAAVVASAGLVQHHRPETQASAAFLAQMVRDFQAAAAIPVPVILCGGAESAEMSPGRLAEETGLAAVLVSPVDRRSLWNAMHAAKTMMLESTQEDQHQAPQSVVLEEHPRARYSVLVAEDNATNSVVIEKIMERAGYRCTLVKNGEEALSIATREEFDAIILDMNMPVMSGIEMVKAYRFMSAKDKHVPVIMFSANVTPEARDECFAAGADEFLPKPIQVAPFLEALQTLIAGSGAVPRNIPALPPDRNRSAPAHPAEDQPVLNSAVLVELESIGHGREFVDQLVTSFIEDTEEMLDRLHVALEQRQHEWARELLHALSGAAVSVGAATLRRTCYRIEKMERAELMRDAAASMEELRSAFAELRAALEAYRRQRPANGSSQN